jgi:rRNA biogenesis protein RRP5
MQKLLKAEKKIRRKEAIERSTPKTPMEFEKAILISPMSSYLWIRYAAFMIEKEGLDASRQILQRAIRKIEVSEEREKLNVYLAIINLENEYGDSDSLEAVIKSAMEANNPEIILRHKYKKELSKQDLEEAEETLKVMCKRFHKNIENWVLYCTFLLKESQDEEAARDLLDKAKQSLGQSFDIEKRFAALEYQFGNPERGRTMLESLISEKPKRADVWHIYIDLEIKHGDSEYVRDLFERVLSLSLSSKVKESFSHKQERYLSGLSSQKGIKS